MAQNFASKADKILAKLTKLDAITLQIKLLQNSVNKINATVSINHRSRTIKKLL